MNLGEKILFVFVVNWTIQQACGATYAQSLSFSVLITIAMAYFWNAHGAIWEYITARKKNG